jgi:hypothetical protein
MNMAIENLNNHERTVYPRNQISVFLFDLFHAIQKIKSIDTVKNVYINESNEKLEIYVIYEKEDFEVEDEINKYILDWENDYAYFPEVFIYPLDMIENEVSAIPKNAMVI